MTAPQNTDAADAAGDRSPEASSRGVHHLTHARRRSRPDPGAVGARFLPPSTDQPGWRLVDLIIGWIFLAIAACYLYRVLSGTVVTSLPGEPGGGLP